MEVQSFATSGSAVQLPTSKALVSRSNGLKCSVEPISVPFAIYCCVRRVEIGPFCYPTASVACEKARILHELHDFESCVFEVCSVYSRCGGSCTFVISAVHL